VLLDEVRRMQAGRQILPLVGRPQSRTATSGSITVEVFRNRFLYLCRIYRQNSITSICCGFVVVVLGVSTRHLVSHNFFFWGGARDFLEAKNKFEDSCLLYYGYRKMIAVKMVFVRFGVWAKNKFGRGSAAPQPSPVAVPGWWTF